MLSNHLVLCAPFSSCLQSFPASGSFPVSQFFTSGGQSIEASASASVLSMNIQRFISFRIGSFDLLAVQGTLSLLQEHSSKISVFWHSAFSMGQLSHSYLIAGNTIALTIWTFVGKVMSLLFNTLSRFVIAILPGSKCLLFPFIDKKTEDKVMQILQSKTQTQT